jgi:uncharacterized protein
MSVPPPAARIATIDAVRGLAVLGILLLNIVAFAMPGYAYVDPTFYGGAEGANWWAWAIAFVVADGKMRGLFTMLFGASTVLIAERALTTGEPPATLHYARMASLFVIGMIHAYLIWSGDILVLYAVCGALAFAAWRWDVSRLLAVAVLLMGAQLAGGIASHVAARHFETRATAPDAAPELREKWQKFQRNLGDLRTTIPAELAAFGGGWREALPKRVAVTWDAQRHVLPRTIPETIALMLVGMALYRSGFFSGRWSRRRYRTVMLVGYGACLPLYAAIAWWIGRSNFDPITMLLTEPLHLVLLRPWLALAHAAALILLVQGNAMPWLTSRLAAAGRMAFSNYLGTSLICTFLFCGYGLGWYGKLERWQLYPIVALVWAAILLWSKPWLARFDHGPAEWLWRACVRKILALLRRMPAMS